MDEWTLNDLLECSVCLERLDTSSKVLPCQHTFCRKCLEEIVATHKELRCPECRILVDVQIDDLPPNVLLMRILEGMKNSGNPAPKKKAAVAAATPFARVPPTGQTMAGPPHPQALPVVQQGPANQTYNNMDANKVQPVQKQNTLPTQPFARAIYDYISKEAGDLSFRKGDVILLHRKVDAQWCQGESGGKTGIFPISYVQVIIPLPKQVATCRALYDFRMVNDEDEGCLSFRKDEVITVIRRVDENWAEGKLNDHIGIFPLAFVEMNNIAQALMKLSINSQPGPSRIAPPTPSAEESAPLILTDHSGVISNSVGLHPSGQNHVDTVGTQNSTSARVATCVVSGAESGSTLSSSTSTPSSSSITPNSSSNTSSSSNSAPNSPPSSQPPPPASSAHVGPNPFLPAPSQPTPVQMILQTSHIAYTSPGPQAHPAGPGQSVPGSEPLVDTHCLWSPFQPVDVAASASPFGQNPKEKRHSFSAVTTPNHHGCANSTKHAGDTNHSGPASESQNGQLNRHGSQRHKRSGSDLSSGPFLPACYVALYSYKPQKVDELELKKGSLYWVTERCQDGWFKGTSGKTQKSGVFPGNYVTLAKSFQGVRSKDVRGLSGSGTASASTPLHKTLHPHQATAKSHKSAGIYGQLGPPELPPRASSPSVRHQRTAYQNSSGSSSWASASGDVTVSQKNVGESGSHTPLAASLDGRTSASSACVTPVPNTSSSSSSTPSKSAEKAKEKKEKSGGLIKRLTIMKRSKSPPAAASYSMDNPVFDDAVAGSPQSPPSPVQVSAADAALAKTTLLRQQQQPHSHPVHLRSGSCPSQLIAVKQDGGGGLNYRGLGSASVSARLKHRERPSISNASFVSSGSRPLESQTVAKVALSGGSSHRKSNSLDAGDARKPRQLVPPVRERFRCIVPYPPNSEYELELKVGDIIYVHRKREDGWYKGTQQRTGRTGLFPASFVETY